MNLMNWDDVRIFLAIARNGNLRQAAEVAEVSQPTAGRRLAALEQALGVRLFDKTRAGHQLTETGAALMPMARQMERCAMQLVRRGNDIADMYRGTVRISAADWPSEFLAGRVAAFRDALPHMRLELVTAEESVGLGRREADITVRHGLPASGEFKTRKLGLMACAIYGSVGYVAANSDALSDRRYETCEWISFTEEQAHYAGMRWLRERLGERQPAAQATRTSSIRDIVATGAGLGILPRYLGDADPRLRRVSETIEALEADYWMIVHDDTSRHLCVRATMDWVVDTFRAHEAELMGGRTPMAAE